MGYRMDGPVIYCEDQTQANALNARILQDRAARLAAKGYTQDERGIIPMRGGVPDPSAQRTTAWDIPRQRGGKWSVTQPLDRLSIGKTFERIQTRGNRFTIGGVPVNLRGVGFAGLAYQSEWQTDLDALTGWLIDIVRVPVHPSWWDGSQAKIDILLSIADQLKAIGRYMILDWHEVGTDWTQKAIQGRTASFWTQMAPLFKDHKNVIFEAFNEPYIKGQPRTLETWQTWQPYAQQLFDLIRSHAPETVVLIGSPYYSTMPLWAPAKPVIGENIGYVYHCYQDTGWNDRGLMTWPEYYAYMCGNAAQSVPIMVTEWGYSSNPVYSANHYYTALNDFRDRYKVFLHANPHIGSIAFAYTGGGGWGCSLDDPLNTFGAFYKTWLIEA